MLHTIGSIFMLLGVITWTGAWFSSWNLPFWNPGTEFPIGNSRSIVVDDRGHIYVGLQFYNRVQVYDSTGKYLNGWFNERTSGPFRLNINLDNQLEVAVERGDFILIYDLNGDLLEQIKVDWPYNSFGGKNDFVYWDQSGNTYRIENAPIFTRITRNGASFVTMSWFQWLIMAPVTSMIYLGISTMMIIMMIYTSKGKKQTTNRV